jgi:hypothetical protein
LPNESKLDRKHPWKVVYKHCAFRSHPLINMAATGHSCFELSVAAMFVNGSELNDQSW